MVLYIVFTCIDLDTSQIANLIGSNASQTLNSTGLVTTMSALGPTPDDALTAPARLLTKTIRTLVIAHNIKTREHVDTWTAPFMLQPGLRIYIGTAKATDPSDHVLGESVPFFRFLQINYDDIKKGLFGTHIVLLSDKGRDWHSPSDWSTLIKTATPRCRAPLGIQHEDLNRPKDLEMPLIIRMLNIFSLTYIPEANDGWCCTESVISREAILLYTKDQYKLAKEMILQDPNPNPPWGWGYALERIIGIIFNKC